MRPESCLCVAAGSGNTAFHCGIHPYTHILYMLALLERLFGQEKTLKPLQAGSANKDGVQIQV